MGVVELNRIRKSVGALTPVGYLAVASFAAACSVYDASLVDQRGTTYASDSGSGSGGFTPMGSTVASPAASGTGSSSVAIGGGGGGGWSEAGATAGAGGSGGIDGGADARDDVDGAPIEAATKDRAAEAASGGDVDVKSDADSGDSGKAPGIQFRDLCVFTQAVVVDNASRSDTTVSRQLLATLQMACGTSISVRVAPQTSALATDGRPLWSTNELGALSGGPAVQRAVAFFDANLSPVYVQTSGANYTWVERASRNVIASIAKTAFTVDHDVAIIQVVYEPVGGTSSINVYGQESNGTSAALSYFDTAIAPNLKTDARQYYVVEWTDQDGDSVPSAGDLYQLLGSR